MQEYLDLGLLGWALSRYSGCWVGFKCLTDTVDSSRSVEVDAERVRIVTPGDFELPETGLNIAWGNLPLAVEQRLYQQRLPAAQAFARANGLDRVVLGGERRRLGIVTAGKAYLDVRQGLEELGLDDERAAAAGISVYKVAMTWPLEPRRCASNSPSGLEQILVVEEKRPFLEEQLASLLYNDRVAARALVRKARPRTARRWFRPKASCHPTRRWPTVAAALARAGCDPEARRRSAQLARRRCRRLRWPAAELMRLPELLLGLPAQHVHAGSRRTASPSAASAVTGWRSGSPNAYTLAVTQMGGEGANWIGAGALHRHTRTSSRTSATGPTSTRACWRSARRSRPA